MIPLVQIALAGCGGSLAQGPSPPIDGLVLWLDASDAATLDLEGEHVNSWTSRAPGDRSIVTSSGTNRPTRVACEGRGPAAAVRFDGRNDVLRNPAFGVRADTWTLVALVAPLKPARGAILSANPTGGSDYDPGLTVDLYESAASFKYLSVEGAGRMGGRLNQRTNATPFGSCSVVAVTRDASEIRLHIDGVGEASRPVTPVETVMDEIRIGARHYNGRECEFLTGEIAQLLLYDRVLSDAERQSIEQAWVVSEAEKTAGEEHGISMEQARGESRMVVARPLEHWPNVAAFADAHPNVDLSGLPIRTDLLEAIRLCMHCLNSSFDADRDGEPFFYSNLLVDGTGEFNHSVNIGIPHVTGRCLLGNMAASLATGLPFPEDGRAILTRYLKSSFDNPDHLNSYYDPGRDNERRVELHNMREGLYGLWALMHTDEADWAKETAGLMLRSLASFTDDAGRWSPALLDELGWAGHVEGLNAPNAARMVDPLLAVHRITDDPLALELAGKYARWGIAEIFEPNGDFAPMDRSSGHVHSITSSLTGIIEYAIQTRDAEMFLAGKRVMRVGIREYFSSWGWGDEVFPEHPADELSRGEMNQTGDVIRAALHLGASGEGDYCGEYYELAECYVRSMVLPTQHREPELREFMRDTEDPADDAHRDVLARTVGGYAMQLPNDRMQEGSWPLQTQDITSGTVHALAECWRHRVTFDEDVASVNLLFGYDGDALSVTSGLPLDGRIAFEAKQALALRVRVPEWADEATVAVTVNGAAREVSSDAGYVVVTGVDVGDKGDVTFDVPCRTERETVDGIEYTTTWIGNQIIAINPRGTVSPLPF